MVRCTNRLHIQYKRTASPDSWETWWKGPETRLVHFIGKDHIVFHAHIPAMLKAEGSYILRGNVPSNEIKNLEETKYPLHATGQCGYPNIWKTSPGNRSIALYIDRQFTRNQGQRLYLERLPGTQ